MYGTWENSINIWKKREYVIRQCQQNKYEEQENSTCERDSYRKYQRATKQSARIYIRTCARTKQY